MDGSCAHRLIIWIISRSAYYSTSTSLNVSHVGNYFSNSDRGVVNIEAVVAAAWVVVKVDDCGRVATLDGVLVLLSWGGNSTRTTTHCTTADAGYIRTECNGWRIRDRSVLKGDDNSGVELDAPHVPPCYDYSNNNYSVTNLTNGPWFARFVENLIVSEYEGVGVALVL